MKDFRKICFLFASLLLPFLLPAQVTELALLPASGITSYGNLPVAQLNRAHREQLTGQFEVALLTYNSALAWQPDWVPALAARSELLSRLGRDLEAQRDRQQAARQNPTATAFFLAKGRNGLMPFLALYPRDWYRINYGLEAPDRSGNEPATPQAYFYGQYLSIINAPDTALAVLALQQKVGHEVLDSRGSPSDAGSQSCYAQPQLRRRRQSIYRCFTEERSGMARVALQPGTWFHTHAKLYEWL